MTHERILELELAMLEKHGLTLPPEPMPLTGHWRRGQLSWRWTALYDTQRARVKRELLRWVRRILTLGLGYIDAYVDHFSLHEHLLRIIGPSLHDAGLVGPGNCSGSIRNGCGDPRLCPVFHDPGGYGLPHPDPP